MRNRTKYKNIFIALGIILIIVISIAGYSFRSSNIMVSDNEELSKINKEFISVIADNKKLVESKDSTIISLKLKFKKLKASFTDSLSVIETKYASKTIKNNLDLNSTYWYVYFETSKIRGYDIIKLKSDWNLIEAFEKIKKSSSLKNDDFIGIQSRWQTSEWDFLKYKKSEEPEK